MSKTLTLEERVEIMANQIASWAAYPGSESRCKSAAVECLRTVEAETVERCARIAEGWTFFRMDFEGDGDPAADIASAIRSANK